MRVKTVTDPTTPPAAVAAYTYNPDSQVTGEALTGGSRTRTFTQGRLTAFNETLPGLSRATTIGYDPSGRIATEATGGVTTTYGYDLAGQLTSIAPSTGSATVYTYDALGRRASSKLGTAAAIPYTYDTASQLTNQNGTTYTYDTAGRRLTETATGNTLTYTYNPAGQLNTLKRVQGTTTTTQTRAYDAAGLLAALTNVAGTVTTSTALDWDFTQDTAQLLDVATSSNTSSLIGGSGGWASQRLGVVSSAVGVDVYGSVLSSPLAQSASYGSFGEPSAATTFEPRLGYRGELAFDSLTYLRHRDYKPLTGAFTSRDPFRGARGSSTVSNPYEYANNTPLLRLDPKGLYSETDQSVRLLGSHSSPTTATQPSSLVRAVLVPPGSESRQFNFASFGRGFGMLRTNLFIATATSCLVGLCFNGDNRGFTSDYNASSRARIYLALDEGVGFVVIQPSSRVGGEAMHARKLAVVSPLSPPQCSTLDVTCQAGVASSAYSSPSVLAFDSRPGHLHLRLTASDSATGILEPVTPEIGLDLTLDAKSPPFVKVHWSRTSYPSFETYHDIDFLGTPLTIGSATAAESSKGPIALSIAVSGSATI
jgi:RHS repeat-associated protein